MSVDKEREARYQWDEEGSIDVVEQGKGKKLSWPVAQPKKPEPKK